MGITRSSFHKRRATGGKKTLYRKKRKFELGRPAALTKMAAKKIRLIRGRGANMKFRAISLDSGNFSWGSENCTRKTRIIEVAYCAANGEFVRTNTLVKSSIVRIDAAPFIKYFEQTYGVVLKAKDKKEGAKEEAKKDAQSKPKKEAPKLSDSLKNQIASGKLLAFISSRPGQIGRADGYVLEGKELDFYLKKLAKKKDTKAKST